MAQPFESEYIFGIHEPGGESHMLDAGRPGWIVFTEEIGHDPAVQDGRDYRSYSDRGFGVIVRLNNGYHPNGTIPHSRHYANFAQRCANFVGNSRGCKIWIIGNEMNYWIERPPAAGRSVAPQSQSAPSISPNGPDANNEESGSIFDQLRRLFQSFLTPRTPDDPGTRSPLPTPTPAAESIATGIMRAPQDDPLLRSLPDRFSALHPATPASRDALSTGETITPALYAQCYKLCRDAIRRVAGHTADQVLIGAVAPWNNQTIYPGNARGDWVQYFQDILTLLGPSGLDGITLHTYTHQADPNLITSDAKMNPPFADRRFEFRAYMDFMNAIPATMRSLPVYITETNQDVPWLNQNTAWIQRAYGEIDWWNRQPNNQKIRALVLYRWPLIDRWVIEGKGGVVDDFRKALQQEYRWPAALPKLVDFPLNSTVATTTIVNLRQTPGHVGKSDSDILAQVPADAKLTILNPTSQQVDNLAWWQVRFTPAGQPAITGWVAHTAPAGVELLVIAQDSENNHSEGEVAGTFQIGTSVRTTTVVRMRRLPGTVGKSNTDVIADVPENTLLTIIGGPRAVDGLTWWQIRINSGGQEGWMAERLATGQVLLTSNTSGGPIGEPVTPPTTGNFKAGDRVVVVSTARLRQTPGHVGKAPTDVVADILQGKEGQIVAGPRVVDALTWWQLNTANAQGLAVTGWMADTAPGGITLLQLAGSSGPTPIASGALDAGDLAQASSSVRVRRTPGHLNKPDTDVLGDFPAKATLNLIRGPQTVDGLVWWRVGGVMSSGKEIIGWTAEAANSVPLIVRPAKLAGTQIPDKTNKRYLALPFVGNFGISQLWGENPQIYSTISYDNVPLRGHNGIDFMTPIDTPITAVDNGVIAEAVWNDPTGFGRYVKVNHSWGEAVYGHLNNITVAPGQPVSPGTVLGTTGNTGFSSGPHLHFAIRSNPYNRADGWGGYIDPLPYLDPAAVILPSYVVERNVSSTVERGPASAEKPQQAQLAERPGYAPDQPGLRRP